MTNLIPEDPESFFQVWTSQKENVAIFHRSKSMHPISFHVPLNKHENYYLYDLQLEEGTLGLSLFTTQFFILICPGLISLTITVSL